MAYIGKEPANVGQRPSEDIYTATAAQTVFTLTADVDYESDIFVSINGVVQSNDAFALRILTVVTASLATSAATTVPSAILLPFICVIAISYLHPLI